MPVEFSVPIEVASQDEYHKIDNLILRHAFDIHNAYGRLLNEYFYKSELAARCLKAGLNVDREVRLRVKHGSFYRDYFIDQLFNRNTIMEGKCVSELTSAHRSQTLHYVFMSNVHHASLVNFRPARVQREFVSTRMTLYDRQRFAQNIVQWPNDDVHAELKKVICDFCYDLGLGLDLDLYRSVVAHFIEPCGCHQQVPIRTDNLDTGCYQEMLLLTPKIGFAMTALSRDLNNMRRHLL